MVEDKAIETAEMGDIYADASGKLWRILEVVREPTVVAEEVEETPNDPSASRIHPVACRACTSAAIWFGWRRIFRPGGREEAVDG